VTTIAEAASELADDGAGVVVSLVGTVVLIGGALRWTKSMNCRRWC
jgi:hypothetical protein